MIGVEDVLVCRVEDVLVCRVEDVLVCRVEDVLVCRVEDVLVCRVEDVLCAEWKMCLCAASYHLAFPAALFTGHADISAMLLCTYPLHVLHEPGLMHPPLCLPLHPQLLQLFVC